MNGMKAVIAMLFLAVFTASAADAFAVEIDEVYGSRTVYRNNVLQVTNCDLPESPQYVRFSLDVTYPRDQCDGLIDIYYSYYNLSSGTYTAEQKLCTTSESNDCEGTFYITLGGKGTNTFSIDEWARFSATCRTNGNEFTSSIPATFQHSPGTIEAAITSRIASVAESVNAAESAINACGCCEKYTAELTTMKTTLQGYESQLSNCELVGLDNKAIQLKQSADSLTAKAGAEQCPSEAEETIDEAVNETEELIENVTEGVDDLIDTPPEDENDGKPEEQPAASACPMGALLLVVAGALAFASRN